MNRTSFRAAIVPGAAALALAVTLSACGAANETGSAASGDGESSGLSGTLSGGGASSQEAAQNAWRAGFQEANPDVTVNYDPIGSGGGREQFTAGGFPFAGSDSYLTDDEGELSAAAEQCGGDPIEIPNYVSPIAVIYNVEGVDELNLSPEVIAQIFNDEITNWSDPAIAELNEGVELPDESITAVHRSDESGTTENFTNFLGTVVPDAWPHGEVGEWPIDAGEGGNGTSGVVAAVTNGTNTIGYADASQAGDLGVASVQVGDEFVAPTPEAAAKILEVSPRVEGRPDVDMAFDLDYETDEAGVYPIVLTSYLIACQTYEDQETADLVKGYLSYIVSDEGQQVAAEQAGSAPLAPSLAEEAIAIVDAISAE
ncbi:phosphate-binding protein PstS [Nocardioides flavus (ex Wang et al. 2016)]|uniref:Phosphate-binding protein n=1 Tax=Nocardioides flavus (ex Wang et al. 2016) TaxID=2058780 RepID=A0ABQ3HFL3_9ACTN|nr:phosphate ABC transporter substrate-binding protein PstS [Nocardioides flavus (ex Wang et al. 2016)]GHE15021.1 phosphate-binding protein PstS [Nocardioides flavus (ex Wang et al. 2016)]